MGYILFGNTYFTRHASNLHDVYEHLEKAQERGNREVASGRWDWYKVLNASTNEVEDQHFTTQLVRGTIRR